MPYGIRYETGKDSNGRIYVEVYRVGRLWHRFTSNGERPFKSTAEALTYARKRVKANL